MNKAEIKQAEKLLEDYAEWTETAIYNDGQTITAHWVDGGQRLFYTLEDVEAWAAEK